MSAGGAEGKGWYSASGLEEAALASVALLRADFLVPDIAPTGRRQEAIQPGWESGLHCSCRPRPRLFFLCVRTELLGWLGVKSRRALLWIGFFREGAGLELFPFDWICLQEHLAAVSTLWDRGSG